MKFYKGILVSDNRDIKIHIGKLSSCTPPQENLIQTPLHGSSEESLNIYELFRF